MTSSSRPPAGLEFKGAALAAAPTSVPARRTPPELLDAVVLPTGVPVGGDVFEPGCLGRAVATRMPKATIADDWSRPVGIVRSAVELPAGDPRLSATTPDGAPWPAGAGGLLCRIEYLSTTADGRLAGNTVRRTGPRQRYSVGFRVLDGEQKAGVRHIRSLDLFTISPRLERPASFRVKGADLPGLEVKDGTSAARPARRRDGRPVVVDCSMCGQPAAAVLPGGLGPDESVICAACMDGAADAATLDQTGAPAATISADDLMGAALLESELTSEEEYAAALAVQQRYELDPDGTLAEVDGDRAGTEGYAWRRSDRGTGWGTP